MGKYPKPKKVTEEPKVAVKRYWHAAVHGAEKHRDTLVTAALVAAIVVLLGVIWNHYAQAREADAWAAVGMSASREDLEKAVAQYGGTPGEFLKLQLAQGYIRAEEPDKAVEVARGVTREDEGWLSEAGLFTLARAQEASGEFEDARSTYERLGESEGFWAGEAKKALAEIDGRAKAYERLKALKDEEAARAAEAAKAAVAMESTDVATESTDTAATGAASEGLQETRQAEQAGLETESTGTQTPGATADSTDKR